MVEVTIKPPIPKTFRHSHDSDYWCTKGAHWVPKALADNVNGKPICPVHRGWLRGSTRVRFWKHEERIVRY
jgi:hypothetical protein